MTGLVPIPHEALDDRLGFVGTAGSGKTYGAGTAVELLLHRKSRAAIVDPLGVWWGLRLRADGKASAFDVVIFGGEHCDLPLTENSGALLGETVAGMKESALLDLSGLGTKAAERRFMLAFLKALYAKLAGEPLHLVLDEADLWAPQQIRDKEGGIAPQLLSTMEAIVRRGRVKGFIPWLITQRPAVINKDVLSQVDGLVAFKLTSSQDRAALGAWIEGQADREEGKRILGELPTKAVGEAIVWLPSRGILTVSRFPEKTTFDSSRTPKRGEKRKGVALQPLDLGRLKEQLAGVEAETRANDPKALKAHIARLERDMTAASAEAARRGQVPDASAIAEAEARGRAAAESDVHGRLLTAVAGGFSEGYASGLRKGAELALHAFGSAREAFENVLANNIGTAIANTPAPPASRDLVALTSRSTPARTVSREPEPRRASNEAAKIIMAAEPGAATLEKPLQKILDAIAWWNAFGNRAPSHPQAAFVAGYSHKSGTWSTYLSRLRSAGLIEGRGELALTAAGGAAARPPVAPPDAATFREAVLAKLDGPLVRIMRPLLDAYPGEMSHAQAGAAAGYSPSSGTWSTYLSRLRSLDLIGGRGALRASDWLFP